MKNNLKEIIVVFCIILISVLLLNPFNFWMPDMLLVGMLACALVLFGVLASFVLKEKDLDERDNLHRALAGRNAFLAGSGVLLLGILVEGYTHRVDIWLVVAFAVMVLIKIATRIWTDKNF